GFVSREMAYFHSIEAHFSAGTIYIDATFTASNQGCTARIDLNETQKQDLRSVLQQMEICENNRWDALATDLPGLGFRFSVGNENFPHTVSYSPDGTEYAMDGAEFYTCDRHNWQALLTFYASMMQGQTMVGTCPAHYLDWLLAII